MKENDITFHWVWMCNEKQRDKLHNVYVDLKANLWALKHWIVEDILRWSEMRLSRIELRTGTKKLVFKTDTL